MRKSRHHLLRLAFHVSLATVSLVGCARVSVTPVGYREYDTLAPNQELAVFVSEAGVGRSFEVVGLLSYTNPGKYQILTLADAIPALKTAARAAGANAIIIDSSVPVKSGFISTGISVTGRAIRMVEP